jgi:hypothetical protein
MGQGAQVKRCRASWESRYGQEDLLRFLDAFLVLTRGSRNNLQTSVPGFSSPTPQKRAKVKEEGGNHFYFYFL